MKYIMRFGIALIERLSYAHKFLLISLVFAIPIGLMAWQLVSSLSSQVEFAEEEREGLEYAAEVRPLLELIAQHRSIAQAQSRGDKDAAPALAIKTRAIDSALQSLAETDARQKVHRNTGDTVAKIQSTWESLKDPAQAKDPQENLERHTAMVDRLLALLVRVADNSNLTLDPALDSYYTIDTVISRLPYLAEAMGQTREFAMRVIGAGFVETDVRVELLLRVDRIRQATKAFQGNIAVASDTNPLVGERLAGLADRAGKAVAGFEELIQTGLLATGYAEITAEDLAANSVRATGAVFELFDAALPLLDQLLASRVERLQTTLVATSAAMTLSLALAAYLFVAFYLSNRRSLDRLASATNLIAQGNLSGRVEITARDETAKVGEHFNRMADQVSDLVSGVLQSIDGVSSAAAQLAAVTSATSEGVERQQTATQEVATAINEMSATVQEVARNAASAAEATRNADTEATRGSEIVTGVRRSIEALAEDIRSASAVIRELEQHSEEIGSVLDVIRNVADQTNLLALNAAIEAARAGEHGRGFAVVADEVRTLASRTQQSTQEIQAMIERLQAGSKKAVKAMGHSLGCAEESVTLTQEATGSLEGITSAVNAVNDLNTQIASAAEEQSAVAEEINRSVVNIADISEETSSGARQTTAASTELERLSAELKSRAGHFQV